MKWWEGTKKNLRKKPAKVGEGTKKTSEGGRRYQKNHGRWDETKSESETTNCSIRNRENRRRGHEETEWKIQDQQGIAEAKQTEDPTKEESKISEAVLSRENDGRLATCMT